jgi:hypothetical protein
LGLIKRVLFVTLAAVGLLSFLGATSHASPIRPDIKKLLAQPAQQQQMPPYVPARAGWKGPEISTARTAPNPTYESLSPAATARDVRATMLATMMPDYRILALLALVILLLRRIRTTQHVPATSAMGAHGSSATVMSPMHAPVGHSAAALQPASETGEERPAA